MRDRSQGYSSKSSLSAPRPRYLWISERTLRGYARPIVFAALPIARGSWAGHYARLLERSAFSIDTVLATGASAGDGLELDPAIEGVAGVILARADDQLARADALGSEPLIGFHARQGALQPTLDVVGALQGELIVDLG